MFRIERYLLLGTLRALSLAASSLVMSLSIVGCSTVGPAAMQSGRLAYNQAITETDSQQMLLLLLRDRFGERSNLLTVNSVTANVSVRTSAALQLGFGGSDNYAGNLVPFSGGVIYEENPTISYSPVGGEKYITRLMSPFPLTGLAQLANNLSDPALAYKGLIMKMNSLTNPDFLYPGQAVDKRFDRAIDLIAGLTRANRLFWVQRREGTSVQLAVRIDHYWPDGSEVVSELLSLLDLPTDVPLEAPIQLPVYLSTEYESKGGISIRTRSVYQLLRLLSAAVDVAPEDIASGAAIKYPPHGEIGAGLRIRRADRLPERASVAVEYRDDWFYIDDTDQRTKVFFKLATTLLATSMADHATAASSPVLTVPVSR